MSAIVTTYYASPMGLIKISGTDTFISEVHFCKEDFIAPPALPTPQQLLQNCTSQLFQYFNGQRQVFDLPLAQKGTNFQQGVWQLLTQIPFGKTISYLDLARQTGDANATRAVANANGKNVIAIIVPCHRVIGSNGTLTGYAGGLWRKKWLLEHEAKLANGVQLLF
jgi:methylated-DNA-[protein]-cysteine S-methyltransferase